MKKTITLLFIFFCLLNAQIYAEISGYLYYKNKAGGNTARVMHDGKWWYKYDANGNRTIKAAAAQHEGNTVTINTTTEYWEYEWDYHNRLIKVQQFNAPDNASNVCVEYTYDALNRRIERISRTQPEPEITQYAYGRNGALTYQKKIIGEELTERTYVYLNNQIVAFVDKTPDGTEKTYYTVTDIQGTVTEVYDEEFKLVWKSDYTAFGIKAGETIDLIDFDGLYTGCDFDAETGLTYHWNRWRSEDGSTWLSQDPARDGLNWYGYAGQNPVNYKDPLGLRIMKHGAYSSMSDYRFDKINNTDSLISDYGCAITALANVITEIMHANNPNQQPYDEETHSGFLRPTTPRDVNKNSNNFSNSTDELHWSNAAKNYGLTAKRSTSKSDAKEMIKNAEKSDGQQYIIIQVPITIVKGEKKKDTSHWVGHSGTILTIDGISWIEIVPSSDRDFERENKNSNWMMKDGKIYVKEDAIQGAVVLEKNNQQGDKNEKNKN